MIRLLFAAFSLLLFTGPLVAQDWAPFPANQVFHYSVGDTGFLPIYTLVQDSTKGDTLLFNQKMYNPDFGSCASMMNNAMRMYTFWEPNIFLGELLQKGDTIMIISSFDSSWFHFLPNALPGQSWQANRYGLQITCDSIFPDTIGIKGDSVKSFSFTEDSIYSYSGKLQNIKILLSKKNGLWDFPLFYDFLYNPLQHTPSFSRWVLRGLEQNGITAGIAAPDFIQTYAFRAGDVQVYRSRRVNMAPGWIDESWTKDSLTSVVVTPDSIVTTSDRTVTIQDVQPFPFSVNAFYIYHFNSIKSIFIKNKFNNFFKHYYFKIDAFSVEDNKFCINSGIEWLPASGIEPSVFRAFTEDEHAIDDSCHILGDGDVYGNSIYDSRFGLIYNYHNSWPERKVITELMGYRMGSTLWGTLELANAVEANAYTNLRLSPNPTRDYLQVADFQPHSTAWQILASDGRALASGLSADGRIDVRDLPAGLYVLRMGQQTGRFVKE